MIAPGQQVVEQLERLVADVAESEIDDAVKAIADQNKPFVPKGEGAEAKLGDKVTISFVGSIDGTPFEGNRYVDRFVVRGGKIVQMDVWNDSAERLLTRNGIDA